MTSLGRTTHFFNSYYDRFRRTTPGIRITLFSRMRGALAENVIVTEDMLTAKLSHDRTASVPLG